MELADLALGNLWIGLDVLLETIRKEEVSIEEGLFDRKVSELGLKPPSDHQDDLQC